MTTSKTSRFGAKSKCRGEDAPYLSGPRSQPRLLRVTVHTAVSRSPADSVDQKRELDENTPQQHQDPRALKPRLSRPKRGGTGSCQMALPTGHPPCAHPTSRSGTQQCSRPPPWCRGHLQAAADTRVACRHGLIRLPWHGSLHAFFLFLTQVLGQKLDVLLWSLHGIPGMLSCLSPSPQASTLCPA